MTVTYIGHSGFLLETEDAYFLFDYFEGTITELKNNKSIIVFSSHRHHDHCAAPQSPRRQSHPLRMIAGGSTNHAAGALFGTQMHHLVEGAAKFEGEHRLGVLAL